MVLQLNFWICCAFQKLRAEHLRHYLLQVRKKRCSSRSIPSVAVRLLFSTGLNCCLDDQIITTASILARQSIRQVCTMAAENATAISISPLLLRLADPTTTLYSVTATEVAAAVSHIFADAISPVQTGCLLYALHTTQLDRRPDVLAACASSMRHAAAQVDEQKLKESVQARGRKEGQYNGGLVRYALAIRAIQESHN